MEQPRKLRLILAAALFLSCLFTNLFYFLNIELGFIIITPFRLILLVVSVICLLLLKKEGNLITKIKNNKLETATTAFFAVMSLYAIVWIFLGQTEGVAKTEALGVLTICLMLFCSFVLIRSKDDVEAMLKLCVGIGLVLVVLAHIETVFGSFIPGTKCYFSDLEKLEMRQVFFGPTTVFFNQNDFISFLLMDYAILCGWAIRAKSKKEFLKLLLTALVLLSPAPLVGSTIFELSTLLLTAVTVCILLMCKRDPVKSRIQKCLCIVLAIVIFSGVLYEFIQTTSVSLNRSYYLWKLERLPNLPEGIDLNELLPKNIIIDSGLGNKIDAAQMSQGTIYVRGQLIMQGLKMAVQRPLTGYGPGGFRTQMLQNEAALAKTSDTVDPHCFYIELLSQYGGILFLAFMAIFLYCLTVFIKRTLHDRKVGAIESATPLLLLMAFFIALFLPSSVLRLFPIWLFFGLLVISAKKN